MAFLVAKLALKNATKSRPVSDDYIESVFVKYIGYQLFYCFTITTSFQIELIKVIWSFYRKDRLLDTFCNI